jgi:hypothetical protein
VNLDKPGSDKLIGYYQSTGFFLDSDVEKERPFNKPPAPIDNKNKSTPLGNFFPFRYSSLILNKSQLDILTPCDTFESNKSSNVYTINVGISYGLVNHIYTNWIRDAPNEYAFILSGKVAIPGTVARGKLQLKWNLNGSFSMPVTDTDETSSPHTFEHSIESPAWKDTEMNNITCHTHPLRIYAKYEQDLSPPSYADIQLVLNYATGKYGNGTTIFVKHLVWTVEGVYKIVINPNINNPTSVPELTAEDIAGIEAKWNESNFLLRGRHETRYHRMKAFIHFLHDETFSNGKKYSDYFNIIFYRYIRDNRGLYSLNPIAFDSEDPCTEFVRTTSGNNSFIKNPTSITTLSANEKRRLDDAHERYKTELGPITEAEIDYLEGKNSTEAWEEVQAAINEAWDLYTGGGGPAGAGAPSAAAGPGGAAGGAGASATDPTINNLSMGRTTGGNRKLKRHTKRAKHQSKPSRRISRRH